MYFWYQFNLMSEFTIIIYNICYSKRSLQARILIVFSSTLLYWLCMCTYKLASVSNLSDIVTQFPQLHTRQIVLPQRFKLQFLILQVIIILPLHPINETFNFHIFFFLFCIQIPISLPVKQNDTHRLRLLKLKGHDNI